MLRNSLSRRNVILVSLGLLVFSAMSLTVSPKRARADEERSITGTFTVAFSVMPNTTGVSYCEGPAQGVVVEVCWLSLKWRGDVFR